MLLLCAAPLLTLVFLVDRTIFLSTLFIFVCTVSGAAIGALLGFSGSGRHNSDRMFLMAVLFAALFWFVAIKIKNRYIRYRDATRGMADSSEE